MKTFGRVLLTSLTFGAIALGVGASSSAVFHMLQDKNIHEVHDDVRGITCYTHGTDGISCIPDQWLDGYERADQQ